MLKCGKRPSEGFNCIRVYFKGSGEYSTLYRNVTGFKETNSWLIIQGMTEEKDHFDYGFIDRNEVLRFNWAIDEYKEEAENKKQQENTPKRKKFLGIF